MGAGPAVGHVSGPRIAIVGCGWIGAVHSRALRGLIKGGLVDASVVTVCDNDIDRALAFARAHDAEVATTDSAEAMAGADAVWICTPTSSHRELVEAAVAAGLAIYCEKPLAPTIADVRAMVDAVVTAGVPAQVGLVMRAAAPIVTLQRLANDAGALGRPMAAVYRDDQYFPIQGRYASQWRSDVATAGGGALIEHSIHDVDVLAWVLGPIVEVTCRTANFAGHEGIEDVAACTFSHASGATSSLVSVWHQVLTRPSLRRIEVFCERAFLWLDDDGAGPVHVEQGKGSHEVRAATAEEWIADLAVADQWRDGLAPYAAADRSFLEALVAGRPPDPGFEVAAAAHLAVDAAYRSAALGGVPTTVALL
jgi:predicted dehydrogenase